jgi:hypothetical protein
VNPFNAIAELILGRIRDGIIAAWLKFLFELIFSAIVTFLFVCGTILVTSDEVVIAIGSGMIGAALSMTVLFRRESSKLTKGMLVVLPSAEAAKELATDFQVIQKAEEKKP